MSVGPRAFAEREDLFVEVSYEAVAYPSVAVANVNAEFGIYVGEPHCDIARRNCGKTRKFNCADTCAQPPEAEREGDE